MPNISLESALLLVELVLLAVTIFLLTRHLKEERGREALLREMTRTTMVLTRQEYFTEVINSLQAAKKSIFGCITGSRPVEGEEQRIVMIIEGIRKLAQSGKVRFTVPKFPDRLYIGYRYVKAGAEIRYNNCVLANDLRYMVIDDRFVLVGVPETVGEKEPTKKGYRIPSIGIAAILREHYDRCWNSIVTVSYEEYVKEIINEVKKTEPKFSLEPLARELRIDVEELRRIESLEVTPRESKLPYRMKHDRSG